MWCEELFIAAILFALALFLGVTYLLGLAWEHGDLGGLRRDLQLWWLRYRIERWRKRSFPSDERPDCIPR